MAKYRYILLEGEKYSLIKRDNQKMKQFSVTFEKNQLHIEGPFLANKYHSKKQVDQVLVAWYRMKAKEKAYILLEYYAKLIGIEYNQYRIKDQKTRWGSCSSKKNINLNWRLIMAPPVVFEYVVVHELVHLIEMNHSKNFWAKVGSIMPNYEEPKAWLRNNGYTLMKII